MTTAQATDVGEIRVLRQQARAAYGVLQKNTEGLTQEDSLVQPRAGGNCLNWVVGHLVYVGDTVLPVVGQEPVLGTEVLRRYARGSAELRDGAEALPLEELLRAAQEQGARFDAGLAGLTAERLDEPAPFSPQKRADETVRSLLTTAMFHQAYHTGQAGLLRRIAGREGRIG
ncbi:MAG TPA: DinB family protein [Acidobacteriaceae bacterium]|nr:DinB family protein [Acidobacteriaceae bacterium]